MPKTILFTGFAFIYIAFFFSGTALSQYRDYMTEPEIEITRDAQIIDERVAVIVKMIDRRFEALGINSGSPKNRKIDGLTWGDVPVGTRVQLISDISKLLNKAVDDIDNVAESGHSPLAPAKEIEKILPRAITNLDSACKRYLPLLKKLLENPELERSQDDVERGRIIESITICEEVIEAAKKM